MEYVNYCNFQTTAKNVFNKKYLYHYVLYVVVCGSNSPESLLGKA